MKLTNNFFLDEFVGSQTAERLGLDNTPTPEALDNIKALCENILQPLRNHVGTVVTVTSGYRAPAVNAATGGSPRSQHMLGEAADIKVYGLSNYDLAEWIRDNLEFDQLILEFAVKGKPNAGWVHVSFREGGNRKSCLTARRENDKTVYHQGLLEP